MNSLDPRDPLVVDTRPLGRRPGSMVRVARQAPAPAGLGVAVLRVPAEEIIDLDLRLESVMDGVLVSGSVTTAVEGECVRCLDPVRRDIEVKLQQLYSYDPVTQDDDEDLLEMNGDLLDLAPALRDALVLALPLQPLCSPDCLGLCATCGKRLADEPDHAHDVVDPRWAALVGMLEQTDSDTADLSAKDSSKTDPPKTSEGTTNSNQEK